MTDLSQLDPTGRFSGLAEIYAEHRPTYPAEAIDFVLHHGGLRPGAVLVDVGSGTGISARQFAQRGLRVIGIEPNADMRARAEAEPSAPGQPAPTYRDGKAEATGLPDHSADAVLAAQAFHWFDPAPTLKEFQRILRPGGWVVLMWNERDETDPFTAEYGAVHRASAGSAAVESMRQASAENAIRGSQLLHAEQQFFSHHQTLDEKGLLGRALSASYAPREPESVRVLVEALRQCFAHWQRQGQVVLRYRTSVTMAQSKQMSDDLRTNDESMTKAQ